VAHSDRDRGRNAGPKRGAESRPLLFVKEPGHGHQDKKRRPFSALTGNPRAPAAVTTEQEINKGGRKCKYRRWARGRGFSRKKKKKPAFEKPTVERVRFKREKGDRKNFA